MSPTMSPRFWAYRCSSSRRLFEQDFDVLDDRIALLLIGERLFLGALDGVFQQVVETSDAGGLALLDQLRGPAGHEHGLHVALGLGEIEQLAAVGVAAHLDEPFAPCCSGRWTARGAGTSRWGSRPRGPPRRRHRPSRSEASSLSRGAEHGGLGRVGCHGESNRLAGVSRPGDRRRIGGEPVAGFRSSGMRGSPQGR